MWFQLDNGNGKPISFGFAPDLRHHGDPFAPGKIYETDTEEYREKAYAKTIDITDAEYEAMKEFGAHPEKHGFSTQYNGLTNSCIDFAWRALEYAGISRAAYDGALWPVWNKKYLETVWDEYVRDRARDWDMGLSVDETGRVTAHPICKPAGSGIGGSVNGGFRSARAWTAPRDPLMLDLDGDGLELKRADGSVLFDHDANAIRTGTGWIGSDDGILVRDLDGNGQIDSGRELFGIDTLKANGSHALNGFDALAELDTNADGNFTAMDAGWNQVQVWRDLDQDGISDAGELFSLDALGISRIGTVGSATNTTGGTQAGTTVNGNLIAQSASFTQEIHGVATQRSIGAVDLESNAFYREFTNPVALTDEVKTLPQMQGSGRARDLGEAASLSSVLATQLSAFAAAPTRDAQRAGLDELLTRWAQSSDYWQSLEDTLGGDVKISGLPAGMTEAQYRNLVGVLEVFNGERFYNIGTGGTTLTAGTTKTAGTSDPVSHILRAGYGIAPPAAQLALLQQSYEALKESVYGALVLQTRLKPYLDAIELTIDENGIGFDTTALRNQLDSARAANPDAALLDMADLVRFASSTLQSVEFDGVGLLSDWMQDLPANPALFAELRSLGFLLSTVSAGTAGADTYLGNEGANLFSGGAGSDVMHGGRGDDILNGDGGDDRLMGGCGNDVLNGGAGNDTFIFSRGFGQDTIYQNDGAFSRTDRLQFTDLASTDLSTLTRMGYDLTLTFNSGDSIKLVNFYYSDSRWEYKINQLSFADGIEWSQARLISAATNLTAGADTVTGSSLAGNNLSGLAGNDVITGGNEADRLDGGAGDDVLYGGTGNDVLIGDSGNDTLTADGGDDTVTGGSGNDVLNGGTGNDTFIFSRGFGQDTIYQNDGAFSRTDRLQFTDLASTDLSTLTRMGYDLTLTFNSGDSIKLVNFYYSDSRWEYKINQLSFADGIEWSQARLISAATNLTAGADTVTGSSLAGNNLSGLAGNDVITGGNEADRLDGGAGDDVLYGGSGNDTLTGGTGNDTLAGGTGGDTYVFAPGSGQDALSDYDSNTGNTDIASFALGVTVDQLWFRRSGNNLEVSLIGTDDKLSISNWYSGAAHHVEQFKTSDGHTLLDSQVQALIDAMASFTPPAAGQTSLSADYHAALDTVLAANWH
jgi:Ca2+-binding RTX toxin-like protein